MRTINWLPTSITIYYNTIPDSKTIGWSVYVSGLGASDLGRKSQLPTYPCVYWASEATTASKQPQRSNHLKPVTSITYNVCDPSFKVILWPGDDRHDPLTRGRYCVALNKPLPNYFSVHFPLWVLRTDPGGEAMAAQDHERKGHSGQHCNWEWRRLGWQATAMK